ncbi:MAG: uL30 family ribosomal protein [Candidatus Aenigmarchaeota archaeon]|nr:uL30 family ribosomal protein [Candidatus Aenigmarchaeota archaeon]
MAKIAALRIKGRFTLREDVRDTLNMLGLSRKNRCVIIEGTPNNLGMIKKVKDFVTYGEVSDKVVSELKKKKQPVSESKAKVVFALPNPKDGFNAIKRGFNEGGDLGYRGEKINELLERVIQNI